MPNISLGYNGGVYARRAISGAGQYLPDSSTVLNNGEQATSNTWGAAAIAGLTASSLGLVFQPDQDVNVIFVGNTGNAYMQWYDVVTAGWLNWATFTDAVGHVIRAPAFVPVRFDANNAGSTAVYMWTQRK